MITAIVLTAWAATATVLCWMFHRARRSAPPRPLYPPPVPEPVRRITVLPPVPPSRYVPDDDWLELLPVEELSDLELDARFWRVITEGAA